MSPRVRLLIALCGAGLLAYAFFTYFEQVEVEERIDQSQEAARNPYLGAQRMLERFQIHSEVIDSLYRSDGVQADVVFLLEPYVEGAPRLREWFESWMMEGGHLVVLAAEPGAAEDPWLEELGVRARHLAASDLIELRLPDQTEPFVIGSSAGYVLEPSGQADHSAGTPPRMLQFAIGEGRLTVLSEKAFATSSQLGAHDHAELVWYLATQHQAQSALFILSRGAPGLLFLLRRHAAPVLVSGVTLLICWIWFRARRFGPLMPPAEVPRRSLLEHVDASGRLLWEAGAGRELVEAARASVRKRLERRFPSWRGLAREQQIEQLARITRLEASEANALFQSVDNLDEVSFTRLMRSLEKLRGAI